MTKRKSGRKRASKRLTANVVGRRKRSVRRRGTGGRRPSDISRVTAIDVAFKGLIAAEPPTNNNPNDLDATFRAKLGAALTDLAAQGTPFKFVEGFRTVERQQWLFGSGRPAAIPFGRAGRIVTERDGVKKLSNHQGNGIAGSGKAADCYPLKPDGRIHIPPSSDPVWQRYADAVIKQGLTAGLNFPKLKDSPHCELR
jgi:hypothetical protein